MAPSPITGGGGNTAMKASWIVPNFWFSEFAIAIPDSSSSLRSLNSSSVKKTIPALGVLTNPLIESPGKATAASTPG